MTNLSNHRLPRFAILEAWDLNLSMISSFKAAPECNPRAVLLGFCTDRRGNQQLPNSILVMLYRVWFFHSSKSRFLRIPEYRRLSGKSLSRFVWPNRRRSNEILERHEVETSSSSFDRSGCACRSNHRRISRIVLVSKRPYRGTSKCTVRIYAYPLRITNQRESS